MTSTWNGQKPQKQIQVVVVKTGSETLIVVIGWLVGWLVSHYCSFGSRCPFIRLVQHLVVCLPTVCSAVSSTRTSGRTIRLTHSHYSQSWVPFLLRLSLCHLLCLPDHWDQFEFQETVVHPLPKALHLHAWRLSSSAFVMVDSRRKSLENLARSWGFYLQGLSVTLAGLLFLVFTMGFICSL